MKKILLNVLLALSITGTNAQNKNEMEKKIIETLFIEYAAAVDNRNTEAAEIFLDAEFRVVLNNYNNSGATTILTKAQYLGMLKDGKAGGKKRSVTFLLTDIHDNAAIVKVKLEADKTVFTNYYSLIKRNNQWLIVNDIPQVMNKPSN